MCSSTPSIHHLLFANDSMLYGRVTVDECHHFQDVLKSYERVSGQQVNLGKCSIIFSKNVAPEFQFQFQLASLLDMEVVEKHDKYVGLPTYVGRAYVGRAKTETFAYLKERLGKKLNGWQGKLLSGAGKDILIRVVAQTLHSYAMTCFRLPKNFCDELQQMCANFWWGSTPGKKRKFIGYHGKLSVNLRKKEVWDFGISMLIILRCLQKKLGV